MRTTSQASFLYHGERHISFSSLVFPRGQYNDARSQMSVLQFLNVCLCLEHMPAETRGPVLLLSGLLAADSLKHHGFILTIFRNYNNLRRKIFLSHLEITLRCLSVIISLKPSRFKYIQKPLKLLLLVYLK